MIPFLREMSRSDKRFADVLRLPPGYGLPRAFNQTLVLYQVFLRKQTPVSAGGHTGPPLQKSLKLTALPLYKNFLLNCFSLCDKMIQDDLIFGDAKL